MEKAARWLRRAFVDGVDIGRRVVARRDPGVNYCGDQRPDQQGLKADMEIEAAAAENAISVSSTFLIHQYSLAVKGG